jgi:FAD/FMN-containing dehydrogenase
MAALEAHFSQLLGRQGILTDPTAMEPYVSSWRDNWRGRVPAVLRPASTGEVAAVVRECRNLGLSIIPQGGRTGVTGAAQPRMDRDEVIVSLERMDGILEIDTDNDTMTVEAGCILGRLREAAAEVGRLFPLNFGAVGSCQIGGNISTNAGGINVLRYGNTRNLVLGLEVVLADGRVWNGLRGLRKDNAGYDLKQLFIGAEGTLGIITKAVLRLEPHPRGGALSFVALREPADALRLLRRAKDTFADNLVTFELLQQRCVDVTLEHLREGEGPRPGVAPWYGLVEVAGQEDDSLYGDAMQRLLENALETGEILDARLAASGRQAQAIWRLRESIPEAHNRLGFSVKHDISLPVSKIPAFLDEAETALRAEFPAIEMFTFGHLGDGNVHFNPLIEARGGDVLDIRRRVNAIVHDLVIANGGSVSAEHGVGQVRLAEIERYRAGVEVDLMRAVKSALDPWNIMNPGKVLRERAAR